MPLHQIDILHQSLLELFQVFPKPGSYKNHKKPKPIALIAFP
jgi:hypothetical protein